MNSRNLFTRMMLGLTALTSSFLVACSDVDTAQDPQKPTDGITFNMSDVQDRSDASLPKTKAPEVYENHTVALQGADAKGFVLEESTVEGVNPVQQSPATRGTMKTSIDGQFTVFACKNGGVSPDYMYNEKVNANGTMVTPKKWRKSEASTLKFYAVYPAAQDADQQISPAAYSASQSPVIKFSPKSDVKQQADLMVAKTADMAYDTYVSTPVPLQFTHATTAIQFKIGNDLSYNQQVQKIEIQNVYGEGTYDLATKTWTLGTTKKSYTLTLNPTFSTAQNPGTVMNGGDGTFFMIPQTLPDDAKVKITFASGKYWEGKIGGTGKVWAEGTTKTYTISNSKDLSDRNFILTVTPTNGTEREYNQFDLPFTVTSYSHLKGYTGTDRDKAEAWQIAKYETREGTYSASESEKGWHDAGTTLPALATAILKTSGNGGTSAEANKLTFKDDYKADFVTYRNTQLKSATPVTGKDLSMINGKQNTANCYIVSAPGTYKFPLYYGSSRVNGQDVNASFWNHTQDGGANDMTLGQFKDGIGAIPYAYIDKPINSAEVIWQSTSGMIKNVTVSGQGRTGYVSFEVDENKIQMGNAIIAVKSGGTIVWSWHIWITGKDVADVQSGTFMHEPIGFVPSSWKRTTYSENREIRITFKQPRSGKTSSVVFTQKPHVEQAQGRAMYFQWGRKDPLTAATGFTSSPFIVNGGISLTYAAQHPMVMGNNRNFAGALATWPDGKPFWGDMYDWNNDPSAGRTYVNLWDAEAKTYESDYHHTPAYSGTFVKTIYDPSPAGFHVPRSADFSKLTSDRRRAALRMGCLNPEGGPTRETPVFYLLDHGYYWTSEKVTKLHGGGVWGYYSVHAYALNDDDLAIQRGAQYYTNPSFGYNVLPIKE